MKRLRDIDDDEVSQAKKPKKVAGLFDSIHFVISKTFPPTEATELKKLITDNSGIVHEDFNEHEDDEDEQYFIYTQKDIDEWTPQIEEAKQKNYVPISKDVVSKSIEEESEIYVEEEVYNCIYKKKFHIYVPSKDEQDEIEKFIQERGGIVSNKSKYIDYVITSPQYLTNVSKDFYLNVYLKGLKIVNFEDLKNAYSKKELPPVFDESIHYEKADELDVFESYLLRKGSRKIIDVEDFEEPISSEEYLFPKYPTIDRDVGTYILSFLEVHQILKFRLVSKTANAYAMDNRIWKSFCEYEMNNHKWLPQKPLDEINENQIHYFLFYRKFIYPLLVDFEILKNHFIERCEVEEEVFNYEKANEHLRIGAFIDVKKVKPNSLPLGSSKMGGTPDLPKSIKWPENHVFLCQLNLSELRKEGGLVFHQSVASSLPKTGILYFFGEINEFRGKCFYYNGSIDELQRTEIDKEVYESCGFDDGLNECAIKLVETLSFNPSKAHEIVDMDEEEMDEVDDFFSDYIFSVYRGPYHCLFGYEYAIQDQMSNGKTKNLLLQLDKDEVIGFAFGDGGCFYFLTNKKTKFKEGEVNLISDLQSH